MVHHKLQHEIVLLQQGAGSLIALAWLQQHGSTSKLQPAAWNLGDKHMALAWQAITFDIARSGTPCQHPFGLSSSLANPCTAVLLLDVAASIYLCQPLSTLATADNTRFVCCRHRCAPLQASRHLPRCPCQDQSLCRWWEQNRHHQLRGTLAAGAGQR